MLAKGIALQNYELKKEGLITCLKQLNAALQPICLNKQTSNLFRKQRSVGHGMDVRHFDQVLEVDPINLTVNVEGMTTYESLVTACLQHHCLPTVVPELKTITVGGALTGLGIESSSFKYGLMHETVTEFEVLLSDGRVVLCTKDNECQDLFKGFPNSYGTLGYALRLKIKLYPIKPYVKLTHLHFTDSKAYFNALEELAIENKSKEAVHFLEGVAFSKNNYYISTATLVETAPYLSDYTYKNIYYHSITQRNEDYLNIYDYIWRWDTDWFWCSKVFYAENAFIRTLFGRSRLNSAFYGKIRRFFANNVWVQPLYRLFNSKSESVIQDVQIPIKHAREFLTFFEDTVDIKPVWLCPTMPYDKNSDYDLYKMDPEIMYVNFGFWDKKPRALEEAYYNRMIEKKVQDLSGKKSLYSNCYYTKNEFMEIYNQSAYDILKSKYDSKKILKSLYEKCCE